MYLISLIKGSNRNISSPMLYIYHSLSRTSPQPSANKLCPSQCGSTVGPTSNPTHVVLHVPHWLAEWDICSGRHSWHTCCPVRSGGSDSVRSDHHCLHWQHTVCRAVSLFCLQHKTEWVIAKTTFHSHSTSHTRHLCSVGITTVAVIYNFE